MWWRSRRNRIPVRHTRPHPLATDYETFTLPSYHGDIPSGGGMHAHPSGEGIMHRLMAGVTILEHELSELRLVVERQTGILLDCPNSVLAAHVADYLESQDLESAASLMDRLRSADQDPSTLPAFLDGVLNVSSGFFRHPGAMNALARQVVPQLYARKSDDGFCTLRIWSAGCSTGEEAYSIAMALCDAIPGGNGNSNGASNGNASRDAREKSGASRNGGIAENSVAAGAGQSMAGQSMKDWSIH